MNDDFGYVEDESDYLPSDPDQELGPDDLDGVLFPGEEDA